MKTQRRESDKEMGAPICQCHLLASQNLAPVETPNEIPHPSQTSYLAVSMTLAIKLKIVSFTIRFRASTAALKCDKSTTVNVIVGVDL